MEFGGEVLIGLSKIILGFWAVIFIRKAKNIMGGVWGDTLNILSLSIYSLTLATLFNTTRVMFELREKYGVITEYPEYVFGILTFVGLLWSSYKVIKISE